MMITKKYSLSVRLGVEGGKQTYRNSAVLSINSLAYKPTHWKPVPTVVIFCQPRAFVKGHEEEKLASE